MNDYFYISKKSKPLGKLGLVLGGFVILSGCVTSFEDTKKPPESQTTALFHGFTVKGGNFADAVRERTTTKNNLSFHFHAGPPENKVLFWKVQVKSVDINKPGFQDATVQDCSDTEPVRNGPGPRNYKSIRTIHCSDLPKGEIYVTLDYQMKGWKNTWIDRKSFWVKIIDPDQSKKVGLVIP